MDYYKDSEAQLDLARCQRDNCIDKLDRTYNVLAVSMALNVILAAAVVLLLT